MNPETQAQDIPVSDGSSQRIQFDFAGDAGAASGTGPACAKCSRPLAGHYFEWNGAHVCEVCKVRAEEDYRKDSGWSRMPAALFYGGGAAVAGSVLSFLFIKVLHIELGLMAIGVGWLVGKAVMRGSNLRGGRKYQILAVALTYFAITFSYVPIMFQAVKDKTTKDASKGQKPGASSAATAGDAGQAATARPKLSAGRIVLAFGFLLLIVLAAPFLAGFGNFIGWIIIAIGLWEAWKFTKQAPFSTSGPYELKPAAPSAA